MNNKIKKLNFKGLWIIVRNNKIIRYEHCVLEKLDCNNEIKLFIIQYNNFLNTNNLQIDDFIKLVDKVTNYKIEWEEGI